MPVVLKLTNPFPLVPDVDCFTAYEWEHYTWLTIFVHMCVRLLHVLKKCSELENFNEKKLDDLQNIPEKDFDSYDDLRKVPDDVRQFLDNVMVPDDLNKDVPELEDKTARSNQDSSTRRILVFHAKKTSLFKSIFSIECNNKMRMNRHFPDFLSRQMLLYAKEKG